MRAYSTADIHSIYSNIVQYAQRKCNDGHYNRALIGIEAASCWAFNLNMIYSDDNLEQIIKEIADKNVEMVSIKESKPDRCVLIDSFLIDNRGLSQQYLRAMMANGMHILVIYTNAGGYIGEDTLAEIEAYDKAEIVTYPRKMDRIEETKEIVKAIEAFCPAHIFLHLTPWDTIALMACHVIRGVRKYQINLTDHAYWMGASFIDYSLEFRPYGYTVSIEKRGLTPNQLLALPYYPIAPLSANFQGFPNMPQDAIKVFTGGSLYKMLGKKDIFFQIMERILDVSPNVYILVAGFDTNATFDAKLSSIKGQERILQIGVRKDIDAVFENCDIYLGTYPMMGGLMSQYAALHGKPIIAYHEEGDVMNATEEMVNFNQNEYHSFTNLDDMSEYASKLVNDQSFRLSQGKLLQEGMMNAERFNSTFIEVITKHQPITTWKNDSIDYDAFFQRYLDLENQQHTGTEAVCARLKLETLLVFKKHRYLIAKTIFRMVLRKFAW